MTSSSEDSGHKLPLFVGYEVGEIAGSGGSVIAALHVGGNNDVALA